MEASTWTPPDRTRTCCIATAWRGGVSICGTTGEGLSLTTQERLDLAGRWVGATAGRQGFKLIVHVGHTSLAKCRILAAHAQAAGAWGIGVWDQTMCWSG
jgi:N-acetylneuraminate lyase